ncbi:hypothetical protein JTB14_002636 [Gonioctena quinquepunctata]|nr:hypothetical protein JTB14_002636 [Gonioctena quinquepunctata]
MVKPRVKKTTRGEIPQELYEQAAYDVINGNAKKQQQQQKNMECAIFLSGDLLLLRRIIKTHNKPKALHPDERKTAIITDTPEKQLLEELYNNRKVSSAKKNVMASKKTGKIKNVAKKRKIFEKSSEESSEDDTICLICCGPYCSSKEDWLQCRKCQGWAHSSCAKNDPLFVCNNCESSDSN